MALLPIAVFLLLYLGLGLLFEYGLGLAMGFYNVPIVAAFLVAILVACLQEPKVSFDKKMVVMAKSLGDKNILLMILVFLCAGIFSGILGRTSASAVAYLLFDYIPAQYAVVVLFGVSAFVSMAMGTSVGTIAVVTPIAIEVSNVAGFGLPFCVASVIGGSMFGDNLSFISDTTIAATTTQGCAMKDKFRMNFAIAFPAVLLTIAFILVSSLNTNVEKIASADYSLIQLLPYVLVLILAIVGLNVFVVLLVGIVSASVVMIASGELGIMDLMGRLGSGISNMYETIMVAVLVSSLCGLIRERGGFTVLLDLIRKFFKGYRGGQLGVGLLVSAMDIATANNTVAIVMAAPIAKQMGKEYGIIPKKVASLLDVFGSIVQGILPYGAQMLVAISAVSAAGIKHHVCVLDIIEHMAYPLFLLICVLVFIFLLPNKQRRRKKAEVG